MYQQTEGKTEAVTVCVSVKVKPDSEEAFEQWIGGVGRAAAQFAGHQGLNVLRPDGKDIAEYVYIFRFDTYAHLKQWEESKEREQWVEKLQPLIQEGSTNKQVVTGLEGWFYLPGRRASVPPPRYKMVLVTVLAIYPLSVLVPLLLGPYIGFLPPLIRSLIIAACLVLLMTYVVMPLLTRLFANWLFKSVPAN